MIRAMGTKIDLTLPARAPGCFLREPDKKDVIDTFYAHKGIFIHCGRNEENWQLQDWALRRLERQGRVSAPVADAYKNQVYALFHDPELPSAERLDAAIQELRCRYFGEEAMEALQRERMREPCAFDPAGSIDQRAKKEELLRSASAVLLVCDDGRLFSLLRADAQSALQAGKAVYVLAHSQPGRDLPSEAALQEQLGEVCFLLLDEDWVVRAPDEAAAKRLNALIARKKAALFFYGEGGLLACRALALDAVVHAVPRGFYARALTNRFDAEQACVVYVPRGLDVTPWTPLRGKTRLNYHHLFLLWAAYGDGIYDCSPEQLYDRFPQYFINIYNDSFHPIEATEAYPIRVVPGMRRFSMETYDALREQAIAAYLAAVNHLTYRAAYADEANGLHPVHFHADQTRQGVMVHSVKIQKASGSRVISCEGCASLRGAIRRQTDGEDKKLRLYSNFLFFLTPVLARLYNGLRNDRPREQIDFEKQHLDYMLVRTKGERKETFPLFKKACVAMKADGTFLFFNFRLAGGRAQVGKTALDWSGQDVDPREAQGRSVCVFTPYRSGGDLQRDTNDYILPVGEDRINLVIIQDRIICLRKGAVLLPSMGVVLSLDARTGSRLLKEIGLKLDDGGYARDPMPTFTLELDPPEGIQPEEWAQVEWAYGGGLSLMLDGRGICDEDGPGMLQYLQEEGWLSPLSRQTQESALHLPSRHPRTAIGVTEAGALVILVYSGRTKRSGGADYGQMIALARKLYPDIRQLMNVDGGGSAMLGMSIGSDFMELSYPSTSLDSCAGMARPINTALCIEMT